MCGSPNLSLFQVTKNAVEALKSNVKITLAFCK